MKVFISSLESSIRVYLWSFLQHISETCLVYFNVVIIRKQEYETDKVLNALC